MCRALDISLLVGCCVRQVGPTARREQIRPAACSVRGLAARAGIELEPLFATAAYRQHQHDVEAFALVHYAALLGPVLPAAGAVARGLALLTMSTG